MPSLACLPNEAREGTQVWNPDHAVATIAEKRQPSQGLCFTGGGSQIRS